MIRKLTKLFGSDRNVPNPDETVLEQEEFFPDVRNDQFGTHLQMASSERVPEFTEE